ncbi:MAG: ARPP-1 family domain-containing protein, partial [Polyangia bacterium]
MRPLLAIVALVGLAGATAADEGLGLSPGQKMLSPITFRQLSVFPVVQTAVAVDKTQYLTLSEGLHKKLVTVAELAGGGSVNTLNVTNKSEKPLLILGGEVVLGGQQDR